ncbi:hypothetical protein BX285_0616 [Streptomyces sp. 1114.5]|uniref:hypothetical protein n=1 Tax=unclassified Streptomyces TaxID=2593676 RepID=UPI000BD13A18|nr:MULTISPECIES: hypothetical protein [unclassified Streptomyces]RKT16284.1 hypothetical protein BX285_0616 [Streptomyces sp. 1114.5]SOB82457.1 hypothetical protein SAMN06272789_2622 [Streptomyces sp. 1331.2]
MDAFETRLHSAWEWWDAAIEDAQEGRWTRTPLERRATDEIAAAVPAYLDPSADIPWPARLDRLASWAGTIRRAARAGGWQLRPVDGVTPPRPAGMAELLCAIHAVGEQAEAWLRRLPVDGPPPAREVVKVEAFLSGPGSAEDLRQFFYD